MFWIGVERGRYLFILFSVTAIIASLTCLEHMDLTRIQITPGVLLSGILTFTIVCNLISFLVSKRIYQKNTRQAFPFKPAGSYLFSFYIFRTGKTLFPFRYREVFYLPELPGKY